jgi:hypothetical protein
MASFLPEWRRDALEKKLSHAYGSAEDLPAILAALARSESACLGRIVEQWMPATKGCPNGLAIGSERPLLPTLGESFELPTVITPVWAAGL